MMFTLTQLVVVSVLAGVIGLVVGALLGFSAGCEQLGSYDRSEMDDPE